MIKLLDILLTEAIAGDETWKVESILIDNRVKNKNEEPTDGSTPNPTYTNEITLSNASGKTIQFKGDQLAVASYITSTYDSNNNVVKLTNPTSIDEYFKSGKFNKYIFIVTNKIYATANKVSTGTSTGQPTKKIGLGYFIKKLGGRPQYYTVDI